MATKKVLKAQTDAELLSYIINSDPILSAEVDLPVQGQSIQPIGQIIVNNERYRNAFINTVNLIGLTVIKRNGWENPWNFTKRGELRFGQQIREIVLDLCKAHDYNVEFSDKTGFLKTEVPNVFQYIHELNFQKFYKTTISRNQMNMAFDGEGSLFDFIDEAIQMLYESLAYDTYITDKYMLCRRLLDGTVTPFEISDFENLDERQKVSAIKGVSNKLSFRSPNYNPAGIRRATSFDRQILIVNTEFEAGFSTEVLATSYFRDEAQFRSRLALIDSFSDHDTSRLEELLLSAYVPFTTDELEQLKNVPGVIMSDEWFMDYDYTLDNNSNGTTQREFENPQTLEEFTYLHCWRVFSTSPFENAVVFTIVPPAVNSVTVNPATASVTAGLNVQLSAIVTTTGFANKSVTWTSSNPSVTVSNTGLVQVPVGTSAGDVTITATSIFDNTKTGTATITVVA